MGLKGNTGVYRGVHGYTRVNRGLQGDTTVNIGFQGNLKFAWHYKRIQRFTED